MFKYYKICFFIGCKIVNGAPAYSNCDQNILKLADIFCVNESEAEIYTNNTIKINGIESANQVLSLLLKQGCKTVIITLGPLGAIFASEDKPEPQWVQVPKIENPVDTSVSNFTEKRPTEKRLKCHFNELTNLYFYMKVYII